MPRSAPFVDDRARERLRLRRADVAVDVEPIGPVADRTRRRAPSSANTFGAIWYVAPCAQSSTIETPRRLSDAGTVDLQNSA